MSHLGRPDGSAIPKYSMKPVVEILKVGSAPSVRTAIRRAIMAVNLIVRVRT